MGVSSQVRGTGAPSLNRNEIPLVKDRGGPRGYIRAGSSPACVCLRGECLTLYHCKGGASRMATNVIPLVKDRWVLRGYMHAYPACVCLRSESFTSGKEGWARRIAEVA